MDYAVSDALKGLLDRQGMTRGLAGTRSRGNKVASAPLIGEEDDGPERSPTAGGKSADLNSGKEPGVNAPAKFTGLRLVSSRQRVARTSSALPCLVLVSSR